MNAPLNEKYLALHAPNASSPEEALTILEKKLESALEESGFSFEDIMLMRFFSSDPTRHASILNRAWPAQVNAQCVLVGQPPLDSRYLSLQAWVFKGKRKKELHKDGSLIIEHGAYKSVWFLETPAIHGNAEQQTDDILSRLNSRLYKHNMNLANNVIRTWYYMRDVDNNYAGMIKSRVRHYEIHGLTPHTHFIASTGIEGQAADPHSLAWLQAHAIDGIKDNQISYLRALDNMSPTAIYGVNFERGTLLTYGDRKHAHISGTASIDANGNIMYRGDVGAQTQRALDNMEALLAEGKLSPDDMQAAIVYCRDGHDYEIVSEMVKERLPQNCAINITCAPVCRPDWLVEIEGEGVKFVKSPEFEDYIQE